jgi:large subunit ribosomal protein L18
MSTLKIKKRLKVKRRIRKKVFGTASKPRLSVYRSNKQIYGQLIDDDSQRTILAYSSAKAGDLSGNKVDQAFEVGKQLAEQAISNGVNEVVFDRNGYVYHGRVKSFGDGAREGGLKF